MNMCANNTQQTYELKHVVEVSSTNTEDTAVVCLSTPSDSDDGGCWQRFIFGLFTHTVGTKGSSGMDQLSTANICVRVT